MPRLRCSAIIRLSVSIGLVCLIWLQLQLISQRPFANDGDETLNSNDTSAAVLAMVPSVLHKFLTVKPKNVTTQGINSSVASDAGVSSLLNISEIVKNIARYNMQQTVINEDIFGPLQNNSVVIVIQVHRRITYLRHLIVSLAQARDIHNTLLVFSHDYYDEDINDLVQSIDFCKVMQIFYPHSLQTHPNQFPGEDSNDCPRNVKKEEAIKRKCINALHPDLYGHYREAKFTQTKHHWWWKANRVFDGLQVTKDHTGLVLFLEEDHYVAEDFLHVLRLMEEAVNRHCPNCNILCLGTYLKTYNYYAVGDKVEVCPWQSSRHNMGMAFRKDTWRGLSACAEGFCSYDDYNWDWSLQRVSQECLPLTSRLKALVARGPRVFHIGECGVHHKKANCDSNSVITKVQKVVKGAKQYFFPAGLTLQVAVAPKKNKLRKGNGGWGDTRDHQLCLNITKEAQTAREQRTQFLIESGAF
ncbi:alpha-1,6-mannosyl-glycoprotein 2-beta-N-acetylglucosaminyltransferase [Arctopsyche grandis]|uniref:alpha-1,6-mannosyl-glycoprotein 2-beta-N-acetylglucosaminyltransferase n=1 Tax=Arctopsyche grandis TaxID=121162 RepID=UPI00406D99DB